MSILAAAEPCDCGLPTPSTGLGTPVMLALTTGVLIAVPLVLHWVRSRRSPVDKETASPDEPASPDQGPEVPEPLDSK